MDNLIMNSSLIENMDYLKEKLAMDINFDISYRVIQIGDREACFYYINGFCKDDILQNLLENFMRITKDEIPENAHEMSKLYVPYIQASLKEKWDEIIYSILSGTFAFFMEGYNQCILIDARAYPARGVSEPEKDKALRGSKDGFVETMAFNTALIRRRIRSTELRIEVFTVGESSKTDLVLCYMDQRVNKEFLARLTKRIHAIKVDALTMNQESLAECLYRSSWINPFPKFTYTERPDKAAAQILEGSIVILVDNSPSAMIMPISIFDIAEEVDDYYFPPLTGTYLRFSRLIIALFNYALTPTFLLFMRHPDWLPEAFDFILVKEVQNIPLIWQFIILELAIDGLRLAAVNTPSMLSTPLSLMSALVLGEFSIKSGWFNAEVMLYMAFVALASYTQSSYELGYAFKFLRIINLALTHFFGIYGYIAGWIVMIASIAFNKTVSQQSYLYPLIPFNGRILARRIFRSRIKVKSE